MKIPTEIESFVDRSQISFDKQKKFLLIQICQLPDNLAEIFKSVKKGTPNVY